MTALSHNCVRPLLRAVRDTEQVTKGIGDALSAGVTGGNSPLHTNQPRKQKTDRVRAKIYALPVEQGELSSKEIQLFRRAIQLVFCSSTQLFDNPLNAVPDGDGGVPVVAGEF